MGDPRTFGMTPVYAADLVDRLEESLRRPGAPDREAAIDMTRAVPGVPEPPD